MKMKTARWSFAFCSFLALTGCGGGASNAPYGEDSDEDGWPSAFDCDDDDPKVFPSADEVVDDGIDQDCSGSDEVSSGLGGSGGEGCVGAKCGSGGSVENVDVDKDGFSESAGDCDDSDPTVHPGARDVTGDGIDQDCFGGDSDDGDGDGYGAKADCDDEDSAVHPGRMEVIFDGLDQNCDGSDLPNPEVMLPLDTEAVPASAPALAAGKLDGDDVLLLVWADSRKAPSQDLYAQLVAVDGTPLGEEIEVETSNNLAKSGVAVASKGDGFLVTWTTADGVFVRRLAADGKVNGIALGYGSAGGAKPKPVYSGANWLVAWSDTNEGKTLIRAMDPEGVRSDTIVELPAENPNLAIASTGSGALVVWDGALPEDSATGLTGLFVDSLAAIDGAPFILLDTAAEGPALARTKSGFELVYRTPGSLGYVVGLEVTSAGVANESSLRLSSESMSQASLFVASRTDGFVSTWLDFRHASGPMGVTAIYGNLWNGESLALPQGLALHADSPLDLGGLATVGTTSWMSVRSSSGAGLIVVE